MSLFNLYAILDTSTIREVIAMNASIRLVLAACLSFCVILPVSAADEAYDPQEAAKVEKKLESKQRGGTASVRG